MLEVQAKHNTIQDALQEFSVVAMCKCFVS
jgi:hypothetical protein